MITATRVLEFDAGHRLIGHESKCAHYHGHRYRVEVEVEAELDAVGRVMDFGVIKQIVGQWLDDHWDHAMVLQDGDALIPLLKAQGMKHHVLAFPPTAENMARFILHLANRLLLGRVRIVRVRVWETPNCFAEVAP